MLVGMWVDSFYTQTGIGLLGILDAVNYVMLTYEEADGASRDGSGAEVFTYVYGFTTALYSIDFLCFVLDAEGGPLTYILSLSGLVDMIAVVEGVVSGNKDPSPPLSPR